MIRKFVCWFFGDILGWYKPIPLDIVDKIYRYGMSGMILSIRKDKQDLVKKENRGIFYER